MGRQGTNPEPADQESAAAQTCDLAVWLNSRSERRISFIVVGRHYSLFPSSCGFFCGVICRSCRRRQTPVGDRTEAAMGRRNLVREPVGDVCVVAPAAEAPGA